MWPESAACTGIPCRFRTILRRKALLRDTPYIDNVAVSNPDPQVTAAVNAGAFAADRKHVGGDIYTGARVGVKWQPAETFAATLTHQYQKIEQDGFKEVELNLPGSYQQTRVKVGTMGLDDEYVNMELSISNLVLNWNLGWGSFLNSSSFIDSEAASDVELSFLGAPEGERRRHESESERLVQVQRPVVRLCAMVAGLPRASLSGPGHSRVRRG